MGMIAGRLVNDRRGVSTAVSYTLAIGITVVLVSGLVFTLGGLLDGQNDRATDAELRSVAEGVATEIDKMDRLAARTGSDGTYATRVDGPGLLAGSSYTVSVDESCADGRCLVVDTGTRSHSVPLATSSASGSVPGGTIWIVASGESIELTTERPS